MYVRTAEDDGLTRENNCDLRRIYPWDGVVTPPWNSSLVSIRPEESSTEHGHPTDETFIFMSGRGSVSIEGEQRDIAPGDVVYIPGGRRHVVTNHSTEDALTFVSIFWLQPSGIYWLQPSGDGITGAAASGGSPTAERGAS